MAPLRPDRCDWSAWPSLTHFANVCRQIHNPRRHTVTEVKFECKQSGSHTYWGAFSVGGKGKVEEAWYLFISLTPHSSPAASDLNISVICEHFAASSSSAFFFLILSPVLSLMLSITFNTMCILFQNNLHTLQGCTRVQCRHSCDVFSGQIAHLGRATWGGAAHLLPSADIGCFPVWRLQPC